MSIASRTTAIKFAQKVDGISLVNAGDWSSTTNYEFSDNIRPYVRYAPTGKYYLRTSKGSCYNQNPQDDTSNRWWKYTQEWDLILARKIQANEIETNTITLGEMNSANTGMLIGANAFNGKMGIYSSKNGRMSFWLDAESGESYFCGKMSTPFLDINQSDASILLDGYLIKNDTSLLAGQHIVYLPVTMDYNGTHVKIMNANFPPYTKTSISIYTKIKVQTGGIVIPSSSVTMESTKFLSIEIIGGMIELVAVPNDNKNGVIWVVVNQDAIIHSYN